MKINFAPLTTKVLEKLSQRFNLLTFLLALPQSSLCRLWFSLCFFKCYSNFAFPHIARRCPGLLTPHILKTFNQVSQLSSLSCCQTTTALLWWDLNPLTYGAYLECPHMIPVIIISKQFNCYSLPVLQTGSQDHSKSSQLYLPLLCFVYLSQLKGFLSQRIMLYNCIPPGMQDIGFEPMTSTL